MPDRADQLACPKCGSRDDLVVTGISLLPYLSTCTDPDLKWAVQCWGMDCGRPTYHINDAARDELFGTWWSDADKKETPDA